MIPVPAETRVWLAGEVTDVCKGLNGLAAKIPILVGFSLSAAGAAISYCRAGTPHRSHQPRCQTGRCDLRG